MEFLNLINGHDFQNSSNQEREKFIANVLKGLSEFLVVLHDKNFAYGPIEIRYFLARYF